MTFGRWSTAGPGAGSQRTDPSAVVADAMIHRPKTCPAYTTVAQARDLFGNNHVHALLIVRRGCLLAVVERVDLETAEARQPAAMLGRLDRRVVTPDLDLDAAHAALLGSGARRLAVVDRDRRLVGLLCLKRSGDGFCSDTDVDARAAGRRTTAAT